MHTLSSEKYITDKNYSLPIKINAIAFLAKILRYSNKLIRFKIIEFFNKIITGNSSKTTVSMYQTRLYLTFFEKMNHYLSISFLIENGLIDSIIQILNESCTIVQTRIISFIPKYYSLPEIKDDTKWKQLIINSIDKLKKSTKDKELKNVRYIIFYLIIYIIYLGDRKIQ